MGNQAYTLEQAQAIMRGDLLPSHALTTSERDFIKELEFLESPTAHEKDIFKSLDNLDLKIDALIYGMTPTQENLLRVGLLVFLTRVKLEEITKGNLWHHLKENYNLMRKLIK